MLPLSISFAKKDRFIYKKIQWKMSQNDKQAGRNGDQRLFAGSYRVTHPLLPLHAHSTDPPLLRDTEPSMKKRRPAGPWLPAEIGEPEAARQGLAARDGGKRRIETGASPGTGEQVELSRPQAAGREVSAVRSTDFRAGPRGLLRGRRLSSP